MKTQILLLLFSLTFLTLHSQTDSTSNPIIEKIMEEVDNMESIPEDYEINEEQENMVWNYPEKLNINQLSFEVALQIFEMTDYQYYQLQKYIDQQGELITIYELAGIEGFNYLEIQKWIPYLEVKPVKTYKKYWSHFFKFAKHQILIRNGRVLEFEPDYEEDFPDSTRGSPDHFCFKYQFKANDWFSISFSGEKDKEEFLKWDKKQKGFDFYSGNIQLVNIGCIKKIVIGDFRAQFGEGLIMGSSYLQGSGINIRKTGNNLQGVSSMSESSFFRGAALTVGNHRYKGTLFWGHKMELDSIMGNCTGGSFQMNFKLLRLGFHALFLNNIDSTNRISNLYSKYQFNGIQNGNCSFDHKVILGKFLIFGEFGMSLNGGFGFLEGATYHFDPSTKMVILFRKYSPLFQSILGNGFSKNSSLNNESGLYFAIKTSITRNTILELFSDCYQIEWLKYLVEKPTQYLDFGISFQVSLSRTATLDMIYKYRTVYKNLKTDYINEIEAFQYNKFKISFKWQALEFLHLKTEFYWNMKRPNEPTFRLENAKNGYLLLQDIQVKLQKPPLSFVTRFALFDCPNYDERIYAYENDLNYCFSIYNHYKKGLRFYLILKYDLDWLLLQIKFAKTMFDNGIQYSFEDVIIDPESKSEIKGQCIIKL